MSRLKQQLNEDGDALADEAIRLNPDALSRGTPLPGLDEIEVVLIQQPRASTRWMEGLVIHVVGSGVFSIIALIVGIVIGVHL